MLRDVPVCGGWNHLKITWLGEQSFSMDASALLSSIDLFGSLLWFPAFSSACTSVFRLSKFHQMSFVSYFYSLHSVTVGFKVTLPQTPFSTIAHHKHASSKSVLQSIKDNKKHHTGFFIHALKRLSVVIRMCWKNWAKEKQLALGNLDIPALQFSRRFFKYEHENTSVYISLRGSEKKYY